MPKVEVSVKVTPDEFRDTLSPQLQDFFDFMVTYLVYTTGISEQEAKILVAREMLKTFKSMRGER